MNGIDYSKQLAREREYFNDTVQKSKEAGEKRVTDVEKRAELVTTKQRDNFVEDKAELEKDYQKNLSGLQDKTNAAIEAKNRQGNQLSQKQRDAFTKEAQGKSKDFDQRLNDIKSSYETAFKGEKDLHKGLQANQKERYAKTVQGMTENTDKQLKEFNDQLASTGSDIRGQYKQERQQLVRAQEDNLNQVYKGEFDKRSDLQERLTDNIKKTKAVNEADLEHLREYSKVKVNSTRENADSRLQTMAHDYSQKNEALTDTQRRETLKANHESQAKLTEVRQDYNKQQRMRELEKRRGDNGTGELADVREKQLGLNEKLNQENKIHKLKSHMVDTSLKFQAQTVKENEGFNETLLTERREGTARLERKMNELNATGLLAVAKEREESLEQLNGKEEQNRSEKQGFDRQLMLERGSSGDRLEKLKEGFNKSVKSLEESHKSSLEDVTKVANEDKTEFIKKVSENRNKEVFELKRNFNRMMDSTVQDYEQRLAQYQRENDNLKTSLEQKVHNIMDVSEKKIESQRKLYEEKRLADAKGNQLMSDQRDNQFKMTLNQLSTNYQRKLDNLQAASDQKLKLLTNDYETKLKEVSASKSKDLGQKDAEHQIAQESLKSSYEQEKARVVSQYENQIDAMKAGFKDQVEQLKDYKKLS